MEIIKDQENKFYEKYGFFLELLKNSNSNFKIITGKYEDLGSLEEAKYNSQYVPDIDIVFDADKKTIRYVLEQCGFKNTEGIGFTHSMKESLHVDAYSRYISVGPLKIFRPSFDDKSYSIKEEEYFIYQLLEPLIKFGFYHKRHLNRITNYYGDANINHDFVNKQLNKICFPVKFLLTKALENEGRLSKLEYFLLKIIFILRPMNTYYYILLRLKLLKLL